MHGARPKRREPPPACAGGGREAEQLVEQGLVGGHEQRCGHASTLAQTENAGPPSSPRLRTSRTGTSGVDTQWSTRGHSGMIVTTVLSIVPSPSESTRSVSVAVNFP